MFIATCVREDCIPYKAELNNLQIARYYLVILGGGDVLRCFNALKELVSTVQRHASCRKILRLKSSISSIIHEKSRGQKINLDQV